MKIKTQSAMKSAIANLDAFTRAYIECALWTSEEQLKEDAAEHEAEYEPAEKWDVNIHAIHPNAIAEIMADCATFQNDSETQELLEKAYEGDYSAESAGHDFWLTRNGHGAGFWDRDALDMDKGEYNRLTSEMLKHETLSDGWKAALAERNALKEQSIGHKLTQAAKVYGSSDLYFGDDGKLYV